VNWHDFFAGLSGILMLAFGAAAVGFAVSCGSITRNWNDRRKQVMALLSVTCVIWCAICTGLLAALA